MEIVLIRWGLSYLGFKVMEELIFNHIEAKLAATSKTTYDINIKS